MWEFIRQCLMLSEQGVDTLMRVLEATKRFVRDESGATAIEYGLIAAGISVAIISVLSGTKGKLVSTFGKVQNGLN